jgi:hypothetical protein
MSWLPETQVPAPSDAMMFAGLAGAWWVQHAWSIIDDHVTHEARKPYSVRQNPSTTAKILNSMQTLISVHDW